MVSLKNRYAASDIRINLEELEVKEPGKPEQSMAATRSTGGLATDEILAEVGFQPQRMPANLGFVRRSFVAAAFQVIRGLGFNA